MDVSNFGLAATVETAERQSMNALTGRGRVRQTTRDQKSTIDMSQYGAFSLLDVGN